MRHNRARCDKPTPKRRAITRKRFKLPAWWFRLSPGQPSSFWVRVERMRHEVGAARNDYGAISFIVGALSSAGRRVAPLRKQKGVAQ